MKIYDLNTMERKQYYNDSDIFNIRPPKTPERYRYKKYSPITTLKSYNYKTISSDNFQHHNNNHYNERYYNNKKDHINDCFRSKTPTPYFMNNYQRYKTTHNLKKDYKKLQLDKSYEYNFDENNNIYKNITLQGKKGNLILGNDPMNFSSEYNSMHDYAKKVMLKKIINKEKMLSDNLNKSVDIPGKFRPLGRFNYRKKHATKDIFIKNTTNFDLNKSTDNINLKRRNNLKSNNLYYYKSNIFFDKDKEKSNEELDKIESENKALIYKEKLKNLELEKEKYYHPIVKKRKTNFLYDDLNSKKKENPEDYKKFNREGNFPPKYSNYKPLKEIKMKSIDDEYNAKNKRLYYGITEMERDTDKFVILGIAKNDKFDSLEIKNLFSKNGIHMFGEQTFNSYIENGKKGKFVFNIRKDLKDKNYNEKFKKIQNILMKKQGIVFNIDNRRKNYNKKIRTDISPTLAPFRGLESNRYKGTKSDVF